MCSTDLSWAREARALAGISVAVSITMFAQLAISAVETLIVARLGDSALAGVTLALAVYLFLFLFALGIVTAITPIVARAYGRGDMQELRVSGQQGDLGGPDGFAAGGSASVHLPRHRGANGWRWTRSRRRGGVSCRRRLGPARLGLLCRRSFPCGGDRAGEDYHAADAGLSPGACRADLVAGVRRLWRARIRRGGRRRCICVHGVRCARAAGSDPLPVAPHGVCQRVQIPRCS